MACVTRRRHQDLGAAAVEFALVMPVLFVLLFGIIDYGIWFSDSISARQAVRDAARRGVVEDFGPGCSPAARGADADMESVQCSVLSSMGQISGVTKVRVSISIGPNSPTGQDWAVGRVLRVCAMTQHTSLLPFVPFPNNGISVTRVDMPIESAKATAAHGHKFEPAAFNGTDWAWCP